MLETIEAWIGLILILLFICVILASLFIWIGVKTAGIEKTSLKKVIIASAVVSVFIYFITIVLSALPFMKTLPCYFIGPLLAFIIIKVLFNASFNQTILVWVFNAFAHLLGVIIGAQLFTGGIKYLIKII